MMLKRIAQLAVLPALIMGLLGGGPAWGALLLAEDYEGVSGGKGHPEAKETRWGKGWRPGIGGDVRGKNRDVLTVPTAGNIRAEGGTVELDLVRDNRSVDMETFFTLSEDKAEIVTVTIWWEGIGRRDGPLLEIKSHRSGSLWYSVQEFPGMGDRIIENPDLPIKNIPEGSRFHLAFTWGTSLADCNIYLDGRKVEALKWQPFGMKEDIEASNTIAIGGDPRRDIVWGQVNSLIKSVHIYDEPLNGADLYAHPERYRAGTSAITSIAHDADSVAGFSGRVAAGDVVTVTMEGTPGREAVFDVARTTDIQGELPVSWKGWGVYLDPDKRFFDEGEIDLEDVDGYRVYVSTSSIGTLTEETVFVEELETDEQSYLVEDLEPDTPYYIAVAAIMDDGSLLPVLMPKQDIPMTEVEGNPGTYEGALAVDYKDLYPEAVIVGRIGSGDGEAVLASDEVFEIDARLSIEVVTEPSELKADEKSESEVTVTVTDANGEAVSGHEIRFVLATTSQYTGVVGGGQFLQEAGGALERDFRGETDLFGRVTATYTAGFAAKTAIIVARDMVSDDVGAGYVKTYITGAAELELEAVQEVAGKALGYSITVTSSDEWLTADGESEARITALVTKDGIPVEGHRVGFSVTSGSGRVRTVKGTTGDDGRARAVYTAGTKVGMVLVMAKDHTVGISGSVQIELRSDAPAKVAVTVEPELLPADGNSRADVMVLVTDINDNPNEGVEVEYAVVIGSGRIRNIEEETDRNGESTAEYVAGRTPGKITIEVTVRSTVPTVEEIAEARDLAVAVPDHDFF